MIKATYSGEDFDVTFTANTERSDYGGIRIPMG